MVKLVGRGGVGAQRKETPEGAVRDAGTILYRQKSSRTHDSSPKTNINLKKPMRALRFVLKSDGSYRGGSALPWVT